MLDPEADVIETKENRYMSILDPDHSCVSSQSVDGGVFGNGAVTMRFQRTYVRSRGGRR